MSYHKRQGSGGCVARRRDCVSTAGQNISLQNGEARSSPQDPLHHSSGQSSLFELGAVQTGFRKVHACEGTRVYRNPFMCSASFGESTSHMNNCDMFHHRRPVSLQTRFHCDP
ncbi:unnamed protein product [Leuciscus chuanchicus]